MPANHPQANPTERRNQELKKGLRLHIAGGRQRDWDTYLPKILFSMRRRTNRITGQSPSQLLLGRNLPHPGEWDFSFNEATQGRIDDARQRQAELAPLPTNENDEQLRVGELVLVKNFTLSNAAEGFNAQLAPWWTGPFTVLEKCSGDVFILERPGRENVKLHVSALRRVPQPRAAVTVDTVQQQINLPCGPVLPLQRSCALSEGDLPESVPPAIPSISSASLAASAPEPKRAGGVQMDIEAAPANPLERAVRERRDTPSSAGDATTTATSEPAGLG